MPEIPSEMAPEIPLETATEAAPVAKRFKRKLTTFLCQEMLYDFAMNQLDNERKMAVEEFLQKDRECQTILDGIRASLEYTALLSQTRLPADIEFQLKGSENAVSLSRRYSKWGAWPEPVRWSIIALATSAVVASIVALVPWQNLRSTKGQHADTVEVAKLKTDSPESVKAAQESNEVDALTKAEASGDQLADAKEAAQDAAAAAADESGGSGDSEEAGSTAPPPVAAHPQVPSKVGAAASAVAVAGSADTVAKAGESAEAASNPQTVAEKKEGKPQGFVYRARMTLHDLDVVGPKVTELIKELGGEKAGEVELGWKRGDSVRYYHFAVPEENREKLIEQLKTFGPVRISKDSHPRVMPEGQVRFILWIESAN
jgi:hypothetical protein